MNQRLDKSRHASRHAALALVASAAIHAAIYIAMPQMAREFTPIKAVRYDASLTPIVAAPIVSTATPASSPVRKAAPSVNKVSPTTEFAPSGEAIAANPIPDETAPTLLAETAPLEPVTAPSPAATPIPMTAITSEMSEVMPAVEKRAAPAFAERISIEYKLTSALTDGVANFKWTRKGERYEIQSNTEATGFFVSAFAGVIYQESIGEITEAGLRPTTFSIRRGEGVTEKATFQRDTNSLQFSGKRESRVVPLPRDMQDMQSFLFQLAVDAPRLAENGDTIDVLVTNARKVYRYQFKKTGTEILNTRMGKIDTIRLLSDAANPEDAYEVWLAPQYFYLPVKIKMTLGKFPVEQLATRIGMSEKQENTAK